MDKVARSRFFCIDAKRYAMLLVEGGTLTTEAYMGTVAIEVVTRRTGLETDSSRFHRDDVRTWLTVLRQAGTPVSKRSSHHPITGEVGPR